MLVVNMLLVNMLLVNMLAEGIRYENILGEGILGEDILAGDMRTKNCDFVDNPLRRLVSTHHDKTKRHPWAMKRCTKD